MMSLSQIHEMSLHATAKASREHREPFQVWIEDLNSDVLRKALRSIPFLGNYIPDGWRQTGNIYFVDNSGFGRPGEPALTIDEFVPKLRIGFGYAIIEASEFQVYIAEYEEN